METEVFKIYKETTQNRWGHRIYEVSNLGRVKVNGIIVEPYLHNKYLEIAGFKIHRAVAELFIPNSENKPFIDHINTVTTDNRAENLRWVTQAENNRNPITRKKRSAAHKGKIFTEEHRAKLSAVKQGRHWKIVDGKRTYYEK